MSGNWWRLGADGHRGPPHWPESRRLPAERVSVSAGFHQKADMSRISSAHDFVTAVPLEDRVNRRNGDGSTTDRTNETDQEQPGRGSGSAPCDSWSGSPVVSVVRPRTSRCPRRAYPRSPQPLGPTGPRADRRGLVQQPGPLLLPGQPLELPPPRVVGQQERLLAMQHRRVRARRVIACSRSRGSAG